MSLSTAKGLIRRIKAFLRWCATTAEVLTLPANFGEQYPIKIRNGSNKPNRLADKTYTVDEVKTLLGCGLPKRTQLYALLMLNCGFTQQDLSDLHPAEIDWQNGTITRQRSKTAGQNVPEVTYHLWPETAELLRQLGNRTGDRALTTSNGSRLVYRDRTAGAEKTIDNINNAWRFAKKRSGINKPPSYLRKTGASMLRNSEYGDVVQLYLGHASRTVADKYYAAPPLERLAKATQWLRDQYFPT